MDANATKKCKGNSLNGDLKESPFVIVFEYEASNEGYWCYEQMILQLEDCLDVLKTLYSHYDLLILFDHSCGHNKQQPNGLNAQNMSTNYGGQQSILRQKVIKQVDGYLEPYRHTLNVGSIQNFVFQDDDDDPFWMSEQKRAEKKEDKVLEGQTRKRKFTKVELVHELREKNILVTSTYQKSRNAVMKTKFKPIKIWQK
jgi:hypothetical protein